MKNYKTVFPEKYTDEERKTLDLINEELVGNRDSKPFCQGGLVSNKVLQTSTDAKMSLEADGFTMGLYANGIDPYNPLFNNREYAAKTRFGNIIAVPFYKEGGIMFPTLDAAIFGDCVYANDGGEIEFFEPIYAGDIFTSEKHEQSYRDITPEEGHFFRIFRTLGSSTLYNQHGRKVLTSTFYGRNAFAQEISESDEGIQANINVVSQSEEPHTYSDEDWDRIYGMWEAEYIRGDNTLNWKDVSVGDEIVPVCTGPLTELESIRCYGLQIMQMPPLREAMKHRKTLLGSFFGNHGVFYMMENFRYGNMGIPGRQASMYHAYVRGQMVRMLTNYIGDDGWLQSFIWRTPCEECIRTDDPEKLLQDVPFMKDRKVDHYAVVEDCLIARGYVVDKVADTKNVEIITWVETFTGAVCMTGKAQVILQ